MLDRRLLHYVSLGGPGGVERHLSAFVNRALARGDGWQHAVLAAGGRVHASIAASLDSSLVVGREKYAGRFKLPAKPRALRRAALRSGFARARPDVVLIWNRPVRSRSLLEAVTPACWLAWEHGAAWHSQAEARRKAYYARCPRIIANSEATRRVLALRWGREERVDVCLNALRPDVLPARAAPRQPPARRLRLGMAGRSASIKGGPIVLHALALLHARGVEAELHVAGDGPCREALDTLARRLAVSGSVIRHGFVEDMSPFYSGIDCLVHPALHESFGLVCLEAALHGCPVVAAAVDGLPEIVRHEATGFCIAPELPVSDYAALGGTLEGVPAFVYDPVNDALAPPGLVSPRALADAVERLLDPGTFAELSAGAARLARERFDFDAHIEAVMSIVRSAREEQAGGA